MIEDREDREHLERIVTQVKEHLESESAPVTLRNVVHAMFDTHYADWLGGSSSCIPLCEYESEANPL